MKIEAGGLYNYYSQVEGNAFIRGEIDRIPTFDYNTVVYIIEIDEDGFWCFDVLNGHVNYRKVLLEKALSPLNDPDNFFDIEGESLLFKYLMEVDFDDYKKRVNSDL